MSEDQERDEEKIPDEVYVASARAKVLVARAIAARSDPQWAEMVAVHQAKQPEFRAAVVVAYRAGREDAARDALIIRGDLDKTTVLAALDYLANEDAEPPDEVARRAGLDLLQRIGWMGSDGHYDPRGADR